MSRGSRIKRLSQALVNRIAAGEVVERPASVVKELVENAIDAGAAEVRIDITKGGMQRIVVADDGIGMGAEDLLLAVAPHATSKISVDDDLEAIETLGFRGEALASIASVSEMQIYSRPREEDVGAVLKVHGGDEAPLQSRGGPPGTRIEVKNLFYNTPARKKHLRRQATETSHVLSAVREMALAHPEVSLRLSHASEERVFTSGSGDLGQCIAEIFGAEVAREVLPIGEPGEPVWGFIGTPALSRSRRDRQYILINRRSVNHPGMGAVLNRAYEGFVDRGRYPVVVLVISVAPQRIDVNVHPAKREVRILEERELLGRIHNAIRGALLGMPAPRWEVREGGAKGRRGDDSSSLPGGRDLPAQRQLAYFPQQGEEQTPSEVFRQLRPLGQIDETYLVAQGPEGMYLIDQHAAHERLYYERALEAWRSRSSPCQLLAVPHACEVGPEQVQRWEAARDDFEALGFDVEPFGKDTLLVRGVPVYAGESVSAHLLSEVLEKMGGSPTTRESVALAMAACKSAVRAGDRLSVAEIQHLLEDLAGLTQAGTCPHGRPTVVILTRREMSRMFGRH